MKTRFLIIIAIAILFPFANESFACSCAVPVDYDALIDYSEIVYVGKVTDVTKQDGRHTVTFDVKHNVKGEIAKIHILDEESLHEVSCGVNYEKGSTYYVFEHKSLADIETSEISEWSGTTDEMEPEPPMPDIRTNICSTSKMSDSFIPEELNCADGTILVDGVCKVDVSLDCDPYDYECGMAVESPRMAGLSGDIMNILVFVMPFVTSIIIVMIVVLKWKKK